MYTSRTFLHANRENPHANQHQAARPEKRHIKTSHAASNEQLLHANKSHVKCMHETSGGFQSLGSRCTRCGMCVYVFIICGLKNYVAEKRQPARSIIIAMMNYYVCTLTIELYADQTNSDYINYKCATCFFNSRHIVAHKCNFVHVKNRSGNQEYKKKTFHY